MGKIECFSIQLVEPKSNDFFDLSEGYISLLKVDNGRVNIFSRPTVILADPFLFVYGEKLFLFYESKKLYKDGVIVMQSTTDLHKWTAPQIVLKEQYHLSYPWVFEYEGSVYMIPETCAAHEVRLYRADNKELTSFSFVKSLITEDDEIRKRMTGSFCDSSILEIDGMCYLFTTVMKENANELELYSAKNIFGPYVKHCKSPVVCNLKLGRNAGHIIRYKNNLYRVSQDCTVRYGDNVNVSQIDVITPEEYQEHLIAENILPTTDLFYREGGHQFQTITFKGHHIIATDAKSYRPLLASRIVYKGEQVINSIISSH